jgi:hypothetical protein
MRIEGDLYIVNTATNETVKITSGTITADVDVVADARSVSLKDHKHGGVQTGGGNTDKPN